MTPARTMTVPFSITFPGAVTTRAFVSAYTRGSSSARARAERAPRRKKNDLLRKRDTEERADRRTLFLLRWRRRLTPAFFESGGLQILRSEQLGLRRAGCQERTQ